MLDCYISYMCMLLFLYAYFKGSSDGKADKIGKKIKKNLMFLGSLMIVRAYVPRFCFEIPLVP
jgi:hypothetical protein